MMLKIVTTTTRLLCDRTEMKLEVAVPKVRVLAVRVLPNTGVS